MIKAVLCSLAIAVISIGGASCAQPERRLAPTKASPAGSGFEDIGRVTLHVGQPCTPQIMFDFRAAGASRSVWLAARMRESKVLTDAVHHRRRVRVSGVWRRGKDRNCNYVNVTKVEATSSRFF